MSPNTRYDDVKDDVIDVIIVDSHVVVVLVTFVLSKSRTSHKAYECKFEVYKFTNIFGRLYLGEVLVCTKRK